MSYTEQLTRDYAAIRARLYGSTARKISRLEPDPEPEKISRRVCGPGGGGGRKYYWTFARPIPTNGNRWREILNEVAEKHDVCPREMLSASKADPVAVARFECWFRMREETAYSLAQIGRFFGRDHTTVFHGLRRWREISSDNAPI